MHLDQPVQRHAFDLLSYISRYLWFLRSRNWTVLANRASRSEPSSAHLFSPALETGGTYTAGVVLDGDVPILDLELVRYLLHRNVRKDG